MRARPFFYLPLILFAAAAAMADGDSRPLTPRRPPDKGGAKLSPNTAVESIIVKFQEGTHLRLRGQKLAALARDERENKRLAELGLTAEQVDSDARRVQALIASNFHARGLERLFTIAEDVLAVRRANGEARSGRELADLDLYYRAAIGHKATQSDVDSLVASLNALPSVELAYAQPRPELAVDIPPTTPNFVGDQGYLDPAPDGIDAGYAWSFFGGRGAGTSIVDVELAWRTTHEDFPNLFHQGGTQSNDLGFRNHGTAVLGVIAAPANGYGITGIVSDASVGYESAGPVFDLANVPGAITRAAIAAGVSGFVVIELHYPGPATPNSPCNCSFGQCDYVPMEFFQADYDAIADATAGGTIVVEAGGNGATNLDDAVYNGIFNRFIRDSGAILVGAGEPGDRSATCFSNYGSRLDLQGWGRFVATLGYGDLFNGGGDENQFYTATFAGTSSATPIVTGAAAAVVGVSLAYGQPYGYRSPTEIRQILGDTGTPQTGTLWVGPLPNLAQAIPRVLDIRPTASFTIGCSGFVCDADGSASSDDGGPVTYDWSWGDNTFSSGGPGISHTYSVAGSYWVTLTVTDNVGQTDTTSQQVSIHTAPTTPGSFTATAATPTSVSLTWTASTGTGGIAYYAIQRRSSRTGAWGTQQTTTATSFTDSTAAAATTYQYRVKAVDNTQSSSAFAQDYATTVIFGADLQHGTTVIAAAHLRDLRNAVDAWRLFAGGLADVYPADPTPSGVIKAANFITNLSSDPLPGVVTALNEARSPIGLASFTYSGVPAPAAGGTVLVEHVQQLRDAMK